MKKNWMSFVFAAAGLAFAMILSSGASAQEIICPIAAEKDADFGQEFQIQGEYLVPGIHNGAFQVIANGDGTFRVIGYPEGLPGDGWKKGDARFFATAKVVDDKLVITGEKMDIPSRGEKGTIIFNEEQRATEMFATQADGKVTLHFKGKEYEVIPTERKSPSLGLKAPEGAKIIFDGTNLDQFEKGAKMNEENKTLWSDARTLPFEEGRSYALHLEFMLSFMPKARGQARSNSGVYINENYECQVLDSFGLEGENNECGGFYQMQTPAVNMCFPPLTWQTYDFLFTPAKFDGDKKIENARITVLHNGVKIQDNLELKNATPGCKPEGPGAFGLYLQGHGNKVQYRNIWLKYKD